MLLDTRSPFDVSFHDIETAYDRIADAVVRTPVVRFPTHDGRELWLKLETLQPIGSYKLRGVLNTLRSLPQEKLAAGIATTSSGNFGRAVASVARMMGIPAVVAVPDHAPASKKAAIADLGGKIVELPYEQWWAAMLARRIEGIEAQFIHPVLEAGVIAGAGTVALEVAAQVPDFDTLVVPFGGGSLAMGSAIALAKVAPAARVVAVEPATGAALATSFRAGHEAEAEYTPSFVDAAGSPRLLPGVWNRVSALLSDAVTVRTTETEHAVRELVRQARVTAEGAGALSLAAVLADRIDGKRIVCVLSGGNIELRRLAQILAPDEAH